MRKAESERRTSLSARNRPQLAFAFAVPIAVLGGLIGLGVQNFGCQFWQGHCNIRRAKLYR